MSQENVETFRRRVAAYNHRDAEALIADADLEIEWYPAFLVKLTGEDAAYRGHEGLRTMLRDIDEALTDLLVEFTDVREHGDQVVAIGRIRTRGKVSGAPTEATLGNLADFRDGSC